MHISPLNFLKYTSTIYQIPNACFQKTILVIPGHLFSSLSPGAATYTGKAGAKLMAAEYYGNRSMNIFIHKPETKIRSSDILYLGGVVTIARCVYIVREISAIPQTAGRILTQPFKERHYPTYHLLQHWRTHHYAHRLSLHV
jgi:hypothetical protein